jgi:VWFA-related protein
MDAHHLVAEMDVVARYPRVMRVLPAILPFFMAAAALAQEPPSYSETIQVVRYALDVRVTDGAGRAIQDLTADDFHVKVAGKAATVESALWVAQGQPASGAPGNENVSGGGDAAEPEPRSIVLFIQTDFARQPDRVLGQMKFNSILERITRMFGPTDRVAVVSHDSHLKFRRDFTLDRDSVREGVRESLFIDIPPPPAAATGGPSLVGLLDAKEMKRAAHGEAALAIIARALHRIDGAKLIIVASWGMGELQGRAGVKLKPQWGDAVQILHRDRVPVIALNTGLEAQLTAGLAATAAATGGIYLGTRNFGTQGFTRVEGALAGHYSLTLRIDAELKSGQHPLIVRVPRKGAEVQAPSFVLSDG